MDAKELHKLLAQVQMRCLLLEVDKEVEALRAAKFRNIAQDAALAGEDSSGATQPEASRILHADRSALARPTLPVASVCCPNSYRGCACAYLDGPQPPSGPEVLTIARQPSAEPPMVGRKRNSSSSENSQAVQRSKRTRHFSNVPQSTTSNPSNTRTSVPRDGFRVGVDVDVEGIIKRAGLVPAVLTTAEAARAKETPGIEQSTFIKVFGGTEISEWAWLQCSKLPGYEVFLCPSIAAQPFMPLVPGKPGLLLRLPDVIEKPQSERAFHVLSATQPNGALHYRGRYKKVPLPQIQFTWANLRVNVMLNPRLHLMDAFLTLFSLGKGGSGGSCNHPPWVSCVHA
jgi:hypothetical protein